MSGLRPTYLEIILTTLHKYSGKLAVTTETRSDPPKAENPVDKDNIMLSLGHLLFHKKAGAFLMVLCKYGKGTQSLTYDQTFKKGSKIIRGRIISIRKVNGCLNSSIDVLKLFTNQSGTLWICDRK